VVRLELIEKLYERMYEQRRELGSDTRNWPHRILGATDVIGLDSEDFEQENMRLRVRSLREAVPSSDYYGSHSSDTQSEDGEETLEVDLIIAATGYQRKSHFTMMESLGDLLPEEAGSAPNGSETGQEVSMDIKDGRSKVERRGVQVSRDYAVQFAPGKVAPGSGIWLQGCNEGTHGVSQGRCPPYLETCTSLTMRTS
jgi:L-ornithine N5-oxygenase